jgi:hypothetical protein
MRSSRLREGEEEEEEEGVPLEEEGGGEDRDRDKDESCPFSFASLLLLLWRSRKDSKCALKQLHILIINDSSLLLRSFKNTFECKHVKISMTKTRVKLNFQTIGSLPSSPLLDDVVMFAAAAASDCSMSSIGMDNLTVLAAVVDNATPALLLLLLLPLLLVLLLLVFAAD